MNKKKKLYVLRKAAVMEMQNISILLKHVLLADNIKDKNVLAEIALEEANFLVGMNDIVHIALASNFH